MNNKTISKRFEDLHSINKKYKRIYLISIIPSLLYMYAGTKNDLIMGILINIINKSRISL